VLLGEYDHPGLQLERHWLWAALRLLLLNVMQRLEISVDRQLSAPGGKLAHLMITLLLVLEFQTVLPLYEYH
jgi:hypothetical protein